CCANDFMTAYNAFAANVLMNCACAPGAICATECANDACKMMQPGTACVSCINTKGVMVPDKCYMDAVTKCLGDMSCTAFIDCTQMYCAPQGGLDAGGGG